MINIVLYQPEIPPNTGNIIRLCANAGFKLHLIKPLGFVLSDKTLKRAQLDYIALEDIAIYETFEDFKKTCSLEVADHLYLCTTKATLLYTDVLYSKDVYFVFGPETRGLPEDVLGAYPQTQKIKIPMQANSRSLNLSNAVAIIGYEAFRQLNKG